MNMNQGLKLDITKKLEDLARDGTLNDIIAILNLPSANFCEKRAELVNIEGILQSSCLGCITKGIISNDYLGIDDIKKVIDYFAEKHRTRFITINGRGDPFHPRLKELNLAKMRYAYDKYGIQAYVFTSGDNLDEQTCQTLAHNDANVMISLYGNQFIDADFFAGKEYPVAQRPMQNQAKIAENLRRLVGIYKQYSSQSEQGTTGQRTTKIGMNYVVSEKDLADGAAKLSALKYAANDNHIFFVVNTNFQRHQDDELQSQMEQLAYEYSDFHLRHSTAINGQCQMGAGSSATVDYDGMLLRCPYMDSEKGDGKFQELSPAELEKVLTKYNQDRLRMCVMRVHEK